MKRTLPFLLALLVASSAFSQVNFKPGRIVLTSGDTLSGDIDYRNWSINPENIVFRQGGVEKKYGLPDLLGFSITGLDQYKRYNVTYHLSASELSDAGKTFGEEKKTGPAFLRELHTGSIGLYELVTTKRSYFFLAVVDDVKELVFRVRLTDGQFTVDAQYKNLLKQYIPEERRAKMEPMLEGMEYTQKDMLRFFNTLENTAAIKKDAKTRVQKDIMAAVSILSFKADKNNAYFLKTVDYRASTELRIGVGLTFLSQRNLQRFESRAGLTLSYFTIKGEYPVANGSTQVVPMNAHFVTIQPTVRFGVALNPLKKTRNIIGLNLAYDIVIDHNLGIQYQDPGGGLTTIVIPASGGFLSASLGYYIQGHFGRFGIEAGLKSNLLDVPLGKLSGKGISLVYGYILK